MNIGGLLGIVLFTGLATVQVARATDGYFPHGHGTKALGRGGASIAIAEDSMGGANNPGSMGFVGDRLDLGAQLFSPRRSADRSGNAFGLNGSADSGTNYFVIPEFGVNHMLTPDISLGLTVYGHGGMNTDYPGGQIPAGFCGPATPASNLLCGQGHLGVDLNQVVVAPTASYKITPGNSIGIAPLLAYQWFRATGLQAFTGVSSSPNNVTNRGYDGSYGVGVRVGWMGRLTDALSLGATYSPKMGMTRFHKYQGLFAQSGGFDLPENYGAGVAIKALPQLLFAVDYERINYHDVPSIGNPSSNPAPLGSNNGPGFGWRDVNVVKVGVEYGLTERLTLRAGYNHSDNPIRPADVTFNILAPGVIQDHATLGLTFGVTPGAEISLAYMHGFENSVSGPTSPLLPGGGTDTIRMHEDALAIAVGFTF